MASQEFLASFAVDIDEGGVARLQSILSENRDLANEVAAAFEAATAAIREYQDAASGNTGGTGESNRDTGSGQPAGKAGSVEGARDTGSARDAGMPGAVRDGFWVSENPMQDLARLQLGGVLEGDNAPAMPTTARELVLRNMETMYLGQASRDSANAAKELIDWKDIGLSSNPTDREGYDELVSAAQDLLREPMEQARDYMKQAMDAEEAGLDGTEYVQMVDEVLRKPLEQVKEMVDNFDFGDESSKSDKGDTAEGDASSLDLDTSAAEEALEAFREKASEPISVNLDASDSLGEGSEQSGKLNLDLAEAKANLEAFRKDASSPVSLSANASGMVSAARSAYNSIKSLFSTPITIKAVVEKEGADDGGDTGGTVKMSTGGRFSRPTDVQVAEDGDAEYIIPVKKESRAVPLLRQLLSELSPSARASLSLPGDNALSATGGLAAGAAPPAQITQNNSNVSAPVTIQVRSTGADAGQVGQKLYDTAERYLLRTLKGVFA